MDAKEVPMDKDGLAEGKKSGMFTMTLLVKCLRG